MYVSSECAIGTTPTWSLEDSPGEYQSALKRAWMAKQTELAESRAVDAVVTLTPDLRPEKGSAHSNAFYKRPHRFSWPPPTT
jgi:hypothetical protein